MCQNDSETTILQYLIIPRNDPSFKKIQISTHKLTTQSQSELYCRNEKKNIKKIKCNYYCIYLLNESQARYLKETIYLCLFLNFGDEKVWAALCINRVHL